MERAKNEEFERDWREYKRLRVAKYVVFFSFIPLLYGVVMPLYSKVKTAILPQGFLLIWLILIVYLVFRTGRARCPTCGQAYALKRADWESIKDDACPDCTSVKYGSLKTGWHSVQEAAEATGVAKLQIGGIVFIIGVLVSTFTNIFAWGAMVFGVLWGVGGAVLINRANRMHPKGIGEADSSPHDARIVECPRCKESLELDEDELRKGQYQCPICGTEAPV